MSREQAETIEERWRLFLERPSFYAHPSRLAACFDGAVGADGCARMLRTPRLRSRLSSRLASHFGLTDATADLDRDEDIRAVVVAAIDDLNDIVARAGAIYWSDSLTRAILGQIAARLVDELGEDLCAFAAEHRDLSGPRQPLEPLEGLRGRVVADGWRCFAAWCDAAPLAVSSRLRLKLAPHEVVDTGADPAFADLGAKIFSRAAMRG